jgi:transposase
MCAEHDLPEELDAPEQSVPIDGEPCPECGQLRGHYDDCPVGMGA